MSDIDIPPGTLMRTLTGHTRAVRTVTQLRDDDRLVSGSDDNTLRIWDLATGTCVRTLTGHTGGVATVTQLRDDDRIVSGSWDKTLRIWDGYTGECLKTLTGHTDIVRTVIQLRDSRLASGSSSDGTLMIWDDTEEIFFKVLLLLYLAAMHNNHEIIDIIIGTIIGTIIGKNVNYKLQMNFFSNPKYIKDILSFEPQNFTPMNI